MRIVLRNKLITQDTVDVQSPYIPEENIATVKTMDRKETNDIKFCSSIFSSPRGH